MIESRLPIKHIAATISERKSCDKIDQSMSSHDSLQRIVMHWQQVLAAFAPGNQDLIPRSKGTEVIVRTMSSLGS